MDSTNRKQPVKFYCAKCYTPVKIKRTPVACEKCGSKTITSKLPPPDSRQVFAQDERQQEPD